MPFTDAQLAGEMSNQLTATNVMTGPELQALRQDPTENNVRDTLTANQLGHFPEYWAALGLWMHGQGGDIATTTGTNVPGRVDGNPVGLGPRVLYNDAFRDVNQHIDQPGFSRAKAVANQLRFINAF